MKTTQPIRKKKHVRKLANYYKKLGHIRNHVLIIITCFTALRISDVLRLTWDDVYDFKLNKVRKSISITEKKN